MTEQDIKRGKQRRFGAVIMILTLVPLGAAIYLGYLFMYELEMRGPDSGTQWNTTAPGPSLVSRGESLPADGLLAYWSDNAKVDINRFLWSGDYEQHTQFRFVPKYVVDYLSTKNGEPFRAGDSDDTTVNFGCMRWGDQLNKRINFVLIGKECSLICYDRGGIVHCTALDFFDEAGKLRYAHVQLIGPVSDIAALGRYLRGVNFVPWDDDKDDYH